MDTQSGSEGAIRFGAFELDERARELRSGTSRIRLQEQPFEILRLLLRRPGDVVTREELRRQLWPDGTYVDFEHSLNAAVKRLRAALGDDADNPRFVETLPRRGYRFVASSAVAGRAAPRRPRRRPPRLRLAVLPFSNLGDERHEYFGDGLHEELISQLGGLCRGRVGVLARWSSLVFKGTSLRARDVGEALRADYLLEGSVRHEDDRVRVTARLIETAERDPALGRDVRPPSHALPDGAGRRRGADRPRARRRARPRRARAHAVGGRVGRLSGVSQGSLLLEQDRGSGARSGDRLLRGGAVARRVVRSRGGGPGPRPRCARRALSRGAAPRARLGPRRRTPRARHRSARSTRRISRWPRRSACSTSTGTRREASYLKALALNPSSESAHRAYALLLSALGRHREAVRESDGRSSSTRCVSWWAEAAAWVAYAAGDYPAAIEIARNTIDMDPEFVRARRVLARGLPAVGAPRRRGAGARGVGGAHRPSGAAGVAGARESRSPATTRDAEAVVARMLTQDGLSPALRAGRSPTSGWAASTRRSTRSTSRASTAIRC